MNRAGFISSGRGRCRLSIAKVFSPVSNSGFRILLRDRNSMAAGLCRHDRKLAY